MTLKCIAKVTTKLEIFMYAMVLFFQGVGSKGMADFVDELLHPSRYDNRVRPLVDSGKPVKVSLDMFVNSISSIDEVRMEYSINIFLRQRWLDDRLQFTDPNQTITLNYNLFSQLWVPDLFVKNEKKGNFHDITVPNRLLTLSPDGTVYYSQRLSLTLNCNMNLEKYPMDNQTCRIDLESYGYTTRDIVFEWRDIAKPVQVTDELTLPEFALVGTSTGDCTTGYITGSFSCKYAVMIFVRQFQYYMVQTFVPTILIVALSWVSFWIDIHAVPARISLGLLTVLTMTTQSSSISQRLPRVSYIKAIDIWMTACLVFVFGALIEYSIVNVLARTEKTPETPGKAADDSDSQQTTFSNAPTDTGNNPYVIKTDAGDVVLNSDDMHIELNPHGMQASNGSALRQRKPESLGQAGSSSSASSLSSPPGGRPPSGARSLCQKLKNNSALAVDIVSRILFPTVFIIFNIAYWSFFRIPEVEVLKKDFPK